MIKWEKYGKIITPSGTTIIYQGVGTDLTIESRKRQIPHSNRGGTWEHTSYFVLRNGRDLTEKFSLRDAKEYAEGLEEY